MTRNQDTRIVEEVIEKMADKALDGAAHDALSAIEMFSAGVDRLLKWLPGDKRVIALELARAHGYSTRDQIVRMRSEGIGRH